MKAVVFCSTSLVRQERGRGLFGDRLRLCERDIYIARKRSPVTMRALTMTELDFAGG